MSFTASANGPRGLSPRKATTGVAARTNTYPILGTYATKLYSGQPVVLSAAGNVEALVAGGLGVVLGVFEGVEYEATNGDVIFSPYWPAPGAVRTGTTPKARVTDNPDELYLIKADADMDTGDVGLYFLFDTVAGTGGDDSTGRSGLSLGNAPVALAAGTVQLRQVDESDPQSVVVQFIRPAFAADLD